MAGGSFSQKGYFPTRCAAARRRRRRRGGGAKAAGCRTGSGVDRFSLPVCPGTDEAKAEVAAVFAALEGAGTAHLAAHALFRADNGLWSSLELADGVLTVYELEQLRRPPELVVLSACQSGLSAVRPGDEVMGLVAALLGLGARSVVASVVPVEDQASEQLMVALHRRLLAGEPPAVALAGAQADSRSTVGFSYACFGGA